MDEGFVRIFDTTLRDGEQAAGISLHDWGLADARPQFEDHLALWAEAPQVMQDRLHDGVEEDRFAGQVQPVGVNQRDVEDVLDDLAEPVYRVGHFFQQIAGGALFFQAAGDGRVGQHDLHVAIDHGERCAQLVSRQDDEV